MSEDKVLTRRTAMKIGACGVGALAAGCTKADAGKKCATGETGKKCGCAGVPELKTEDFYTNGAYDHKKAIAQYYAMMKRFGYPIQDILKGDSFWTCDFLQADFTKLGMGGIMWINEIGDYSKTGAGLYKGEFKDQKFGYLGHEIYLLPGQMLPEHSHVGGPNGVGPKMEAWHVRYGEVQFFGEHKGSGEETLISDMPESERPWGYGEDWFKSKYVVKRTAKSGVPYALKDPETWHFQRAGAQGAIVSEYATHHNHVRFSKPGMEFDNTKA